MLTFDQLLQTIQGLCKQGVATEDETASPKAIKIPKEDIVEVCSYLIQNENTYFDMLSCITGIDNGVVVNTMEVAYNLYSIPYNTHLMLKVILPREMPEINSVSEIWKTANWHERELFDMFGIQIKNHPDLRRILLPADWEGHPLRKDYVHQDYYRNIKVKY